MPLNAKGNGGGVLAGVTALLLSTAILLMGNGLQTTLLPVRGNMEQFTGLEIGLLGTGYFAGFTLGCLLGPALLQRGGHTRTFMAMASVASVVALLHVIIIEPVIWAIFRGLTGFCFAVLYVVIESWLNHRADNRQRGTVFSLYSVINLTVIAAGQMMIGLGDPMAFGLFALASVLVSLSTLPVAFSRAGEPESGEFALPGLMQLYCASPVAFVGCIAVGLSNGAFWALGPVFAQEQGMDIAHIGVFMSAVVIGGAVVQWPLGLLSDRMDRRKVIAGGAAFAVLSGLLLTYFAGVGTGWLYGLAALFGAGSFPLYALIVAHANDHAPPQDMVRVSSGLLLTFGASAALGPLLAAMFQNLAGEGALFFYTAVIHALVVAFILWRMVRAEAAREEDRMPFADSVIISRTVSPIEAEDESRTPRS